MKKNAWAVMIGRAQAGWGTAVSVPVAMCFVTGEMAVWVATGISSSSSALQIGS